MAKKFKKGELIYVPEATPLYGIDHNDHRLLVDPGYVVAIEDQRDGELDIEVFHNNKKWKLNLRNAYKVEEEDEI